MEGSGPKRRDIGRSGPNPPLDRVIAEIAQRQHNVIALRQLCALGISTSAVRSRVASGRLHRVHTGVYAVGHAKLTAKGRWLAAVLAGGDGAVLSHRSAGALWGLRPDNRPISDVTSRGRAGRQREGIVGHRGDGLMPLDVTFVDGIPCTSLARTLLDLAEVVDRRSLERVFDRAETLRLLDMGPLEELLERSNGRRGVKLLRIVLAEHDPGSTLTESELEELLLGVCRTRRDCPPPRSTHGWRSMTELASGPTFSGDRSA